jgi:serine/threonine-protein kinase
MADDELPFRYVPPPDPNLGRRVDLYFILRVLLGRGGMGAAYLAEHEALSHVKCVIKLVLVEMLHHPMIISRYHNEAKALAVLKHDGIVKLHGLGVLEDGQLYLRLEYVEGTSLDRYVAEHGGRLPLRKAVNFIFQLCSALQHAHDRGVIHRDLKPDNLMVEIDPQGAHVKERIKILDFGIAKVVSSTVDMTGSGIQMGTPTYMAPEQVTNAAGVDGRADIFSLGQILVKIVTGKLPWGSADNSVEIYHRQRSQPPAWPPEDLMSREVAEVVHRALSLNPEDRPPAQEFAIELAAKIPAEPGEESGTEILRQVAPDWVRSTPPHVATLPHPVAANPGVALVESARAAVGPRRAGIGELPPLNVVTVSSKAPAPGSVKDITAHASPRALATPAAPAVGAAARSPGVALNSPATPPVTHVLPPFVPPRVLPWHPPMPVLAALPTGLVSQKFAAQEPPVEPRAPQVEVASEIELAAGTPGPQPYAHAELPAVMVSNTQLSGLTSQASASGVPAHGHPEPPPFVMLPTSFDAGPPRVRSARSKLVLLGAAACALAAVAAFAIARLGSHAATVDGRGSVAIASDAVPAPTVVAVAAPNAGIAGNPPEQDAHAPRRDAGIAADATATAAEVTASATSAVATLRPAAPTDARPSPQDVRKDAHLVTAPELDAKSSPAVQTANAPSPTPSKVADKPPDIATSTTPSASLIRTPAKPPVPGDAAKSRTGVIVVPRSQAWVKVWIDQVDHGTTPVRAEKVPVGVHKVLLVAESHRETVMVTVAAGRESVIERNW